MMQDRLICRGFELDLPKNMAFPLTFSIADAKEPTKRSRTFSASIDLPSTSKNKAFFAEAYSYHSIGSQISFDPLANYKTEYYKGDVKILSNGVMMLKQVTFKNKVPIFKVQVYSDSTDAFLTLSSMNLTDLNFIDLNHTLTRENIKASWLTPDGVGYRYPLIQYREMVGVNTWRVTDLVPYIHTKELVDRIFNYVGLKYNSTFLNSALFKKCLFGFGGGDYILKTLTPLELNQRRVIGINGTVNYSNLSIISWQNNVINYNNFSLNDSNFSITETSDILNQLNDGEIQIALSGKYKLDLLGTLTFRSFLDYIPPTGFPNVNHGIMEGGIYIYKNGVLIQSVNFTGTANAINSNVASVNEVFNMEFEGDFLEGDIITFKIKPKKAMSINLPPGLNTPQINITQQVLSSNIELQFVSLDTQITDNSLVSMVRFLPEMKCSDFLMGVFRQFNLMMSEPDQLTGVVRIEPMVDFYKANDEFDDVTHLVDHSKDIELEPSGNTVSKYINFEFNTMDEFDAKWYLDKYGKQYGNYELINPSHFAKGTTSIKLPWATIIPQSSDNVNAVMYPRFILVDNGKVKPNRGSARMCFWNGMKSGKWRLVNNANTAVGENLTQFPCIHHFDNWENPTFDINFGLVRELRYVTTVITTSNMYNVNHQPFYVGLLSPHGKYMRCYLKLNEVDISERDLSKFWMINGMLFRKNVIGAYDSNVVGTTKVELIRVITGKKPFRGRIISRPATAASDSIIIKSPKDNVGVGVGVISAPKFDTGKYVKLLKV